MGDPTLRDAAIAAPKARSTPSVGRIAAIAAATPLILVGLGVATLIAVYEVSEARFDLCWMYGGADEDAVRQWQSWPPGYVCTSAGERPDYIGIPAALWVPVAVIILLWGGAAVSVWRFARSGGDTLSRAAQTCSAVLLGMLVALPAAYGFSRIAVGALVEQRGDAVFVGWAWWPPLLVGAPIGAGAAVAAVRVRRRPLLWGVVCGFSAWAVLAFSGAGYPLEPLGPFGAVVAGVSGAGVAAVWRRRRPGARPDSAE